MRDVDIANLGRLRERTATNSPTGIAEVGDDGATAAIESATLSRLRPLIVRVAGRPGVGKSAILAVLESVPLEADGLEIEVQETDGTDERDFDVLVYVIAGAVSPVDSAYLSSRSGAAPDATVVVLTKADTLDDPGAAAAAAARQLGRTVLPVMGACAAGLRRSGGSGARLVMADVRAVSATEVGPAELLTVDRFLAVDIAVSRRRREALIECVELRGLALLVDVLRRRPGASDGDALRVLADATGADALISAVSASVAMAAATRDTELHSSLRQISARHRRVRDAIEFYLASDEAVAAEMRCAAMRVGVSIETGSEQVAWEQAALWKHRAAAATDPGERRSALALCRGYVRMLRR